MKQNVRATMTFLLLVNIYFCLWAEVPQKYYTSVEGTKKEQLKSALHQLIMNANVLKYGGQGIGYTWEGFSKTDVSAQGKVLDRYSETIRDFNGVKSVSGMHIEHSFANSWWGGIMNQAYMDLHHLYPADGSANISKSNHPIGLVDGETTLNNGVIKVGKSSSRPDTIITAWEPADKYKGDFARTYMYMVTCYEDYANLWKSEGLVMLDNNTYPVFEKWAADLLLRWSEQDPVDETERQRNDAVYNIQGNRNPFIDYPQLAEYVWGSKTSDAFYLQESDQAELFLPINQSDLDFGLQPLNMPAKKSFIIRGRNLKNDLSLSVSNSLFQLSINSVTPTQVKEGVEIEITCSSSVAVPQTGILTLLCDGKETTVNLKADFLNGIPAYPAKDIQCTSYNKSFVASWMKMPDISSVTLDVYTKNNEVKTSLSGYPVVVKLSNDTIVKVLNASTSYYYRVTANEMTSNEIEVIMPAIPPSFSANATQLYFATKPEKASPVQKTEISGSQLNSYIYNVSTNAPFELSADSINWTQDIDLSGSKVSFYTRMGSMSTEGSYEDKLILTTPDVSTDIALDVFGDVDIQKSFFEEFEAGSKSSYAKKTILCGAGNWSMNNALIGTIESDKKNRKKSVRVKEQGSIELLNDKQDGIGSISFYAGLYGSDKAGQFSVSYSIDGGNSWTAVLGATGVNVGTGWTKYSYPVQVNGNIRIKIVNTATIANSRINFDDIMMNDYSPADNILSTTSGSKVLVEPGVLRIIAEKEMQLSVYSINGILLDQKIVTPGENRFSFLHGNYVIKIGNQSMTISL